MLKIWAKVMLDDKIIKDMVYTSLKNYNRKDFFLDMTDICYKLDIPVPVLIKSHYESLEQFNNIKFIERDFVEHINFDRLFLELISD